jgi:pimeloyl-ACP methyl ester carboxylesterase
MPTLVDGLASTPLGDQLAWFLAAVNTGGAGLTEADIAAHVAPSLLAVVPPAQLIGLMQGLAGGYGTLTLQGATRPPTATQAVGLVAAAVGTQLALPITVEAAAPHRITGLTVYPSPSGDGMPLLPITIGTGAATYAPLVDVGGRGLYRADVGSGGPTVVLEDGLTDSAATWSGVVPAIAAFAQVVSYDRPNTIAGASDPAPAPRTAADVVADLHVLLEAEAVPGPYVLVGHSVGGLFVRLFASNYPDEVAGLVLVDASHEEQDVRRQALVSAELFAAEQQAVQGSNSEGIDLDASFAQVREARAAAPLRPMPLVVLSAGQADPAFFPAGWPMDAEARLHDELQTDLAGLVPGGRHVVAEQSRHYVQQSQPDLVVAAIRAVVAAVRDPSTWETLPSGTPVS